MKTYVAGDGTRFNDSDIERWASEHESGYSGGHRGASRPGRPVSIGEQAKPFTLRLDSARREKLAKFAGERHVSVSQAMRELIDAI
ncbi:MAG: CopG family transcriptional regulator [Cellulomonadaceae bacterium]|jgi:hypothetical protein|nr:CopG family transcriptional regulator [Cellulomonadaceae bacterium]